MLKHGATTLWEHWQFSDNTFSHNHPMFGSVSQWMMQWLGGIRPHVDAVGYDRIVIQPQTPPGLDWVKSSYRSVRGLIVSDWKRDGEKTRFEVTIPPNTSAQVLLPNGAVVAQGKTKKIEGGGYAVGSGRFVFVVGR
jgi:alpha-L-rhamnosidase